MEASLRRFASVREEKMKPIKRATTTQCANQASGKRHGEVRIAEPDRTTPLCGSKCRSKSQAYPRFAARNSRESTSAIQLASMMLSETPTVPQVSFPSLERIWTRVRAAVPLPPSTMRTL